MAKAWDAQRREGQEVGGSVERASLTKFCTCLPPSRAQTPVDRLGALT
jgi:hypothetical protein